MISPASSSRRMAETMARRGGLAVLPQDIPLDVVADVVRPYGVTAAVDHIRGVPPVVNDSAAVAALAVDDRWGGAGLFVVITCLLVIVAVVVVPYLIYTNKTESERD